MGKEYNIKSIMEEIEIELISSMKRNLGRHIKEEELNKFDWPQWQSLKIKQFEDYKNSNKAIFNNKTKYLETDIIKRMKEQFKEGASRTNKEAIKSGYLKREDSKLGGSFFGLNHKKLDALIKSTDNDLKDVKMATLRMANDKYRQIIYKAQIYANTGAGTVKQAIDMATKDFLVNGFNCIEYKNGSRHNIADYSDMAIRTANKRANLMGEGEMRKEIGISTVYVSKHSTSCPKCVPWQDKVYVDDVWSGGTEKETKYPLLSTAVAGGLFHPRCRHGVSTFFSGINDEPKPEKEIQPNNTNTEKIQSLQRKQKQYERLVAGSLDNENIENYKNKIIELKEEIANLQKNDIIIDEEELLNKVKNNFSEKDIEYIANNTNKLNYKSKIEDTLFTEIARNKGYDKLPNKLSTEEFEKYLKENDAYLLYRGLPKKENLKQFQKGKLYGGKGVYGNGTYFSEGDRGKLETKNYAKQNGSYIRATFDKKDFKIIDYYENDLKFIINDVKNENKYSDIEKKILSDEGRYSMLKGYDAIYISDRNYYVILNRGKLIIEDKINDIKELKF